MNLEEWSNSPERKKRRKKRRVLSGASYLKKELFTTSKNQKETKEGERTLHEIRNYRTLIENENSQNKDPSDTALGGAIAAAHAGIKEAVQYNNERLMYESLQLYGAVDPAYLTGKRATSKYITKQVDKLYESLMKKEPHRGESFRDGVGTIIKNSKFSIKSLEKRLHAIALLIGSLGAIALGTFFSLRTVTGNVISENMQSGIPVPVLILFLIGIIGVFTTVKFWRQ